MLERISQEKIYSIRQELTELQKKYVITQVDKDGNGIAFVCKKVAHKLTKRFIYGPNPRKSGLFQLDPRPMRTVIEDLEEYCHERRIFTKKLVLPQFKITMKCTKPAGSKLVDLSLARKARSYKT